MLANANRTIHLSIMVAFDLISRKWFDFLQIEKNLVAFQTVLPKDKNYLDNNLWVRFKLEHVFSIQIPFLCKANPSKNMHHFEIYLISNIHSILITVIYILKCCFLFYLKEQVLLKYIFRLVLSVLSALSERILFTTSW